MASDSLATRLYRGEISWDFIGRRRRWYGLSALVMLVGIISLAIQGLNPSIDFTGGAQFQASLNGHSINDVRTVVDSLNLNNPTVETTSHGSDVRFLVQTKTLTDPQVQAVETALSQKIGVKPDDFTISTIGSTWGGQITRKAILGLIVFMVAVTIYLSIRFEWKMALAAIIALIHDLVITAGIYSLSGLQVSPSTVIALLTILGYSLYDTVVVFDKVRENTAGIAGGSKMTFTQAANLAVNQTLVRSINTSIIALLPVLGLLVIGAGLLGAGSLDDLSVALFIGLASGAYSSIFIATPLLCDFKEREPTYQQLAKRVASRRVKETRDAAGLTPALAGGQVPDIGARPAGVVTPSPDPVLGVAAADSDTTDSDEPVAAPRTGTPPRTGARPGQPPGSRSNRGAWPGGRGSKSRKRR
jgi:preprotein translocase subunit SecF